MPGNKILYFDKDPDHFVAEVNGTIRDPIYLKDQVCQGLENYAITLVESFGAADWKRPVVNLHAQQFDRSWIRDAGRVSPFDSTHAVRLTCDFRHIVNCCDTIITLTRHESGGVSASRQNCVVC